MAETAGKSHHGVSARCEFNFDAFGNTLAYFTLHYGDLSLKGYKVMNGDDGPWIAFPSKKVGKGQDTRWVTTVWMESEARFKDFREWAIKCFKTALESHQKAAAAKAAE